MDLRIHTSSEQQAIRSLLAAAALPVEDLDTADVQFLMATDNHTPVGAIGLEAFGNTGLLRSLVVRPEHRGMGIANQLVDALESLARGSDIDQLVLLTQTAAPFFAARGYRVITRDQAPESVRKSAEFRSLCPASATCMIKLLDR